MPVQPCVVMEIRRQLHLPNGYSWLLVIPNVYTAHSKKRECSVT